MGSLTGAEAWVAPEVGASGRWDPSHARAVAPRDDRWCDVPMPSTTPRMPSARLALARPARGRSRRATAVGVTGLALALLLGACGETSTPTPAGSGTSATPTASPTAAPSGTASEVRVARVGGVAGFQDDLGVAPDGHVTGTTRNGAVECTVPVETARVLATAAAPTTGLNAGNDRIAASVERAGTTIDLGEAQGSDPLSTTARELLDDVQQPEGQRTVCR